MMADQKDVCPVTGRVCDVAEVCALFWCAKTGTRMRGQKLRPVTFAEAWPYHATPLAELKAMWDNPDDCDCDGVHAELNRRGEGSYCAV